MNHIYNFLKELKPYDFPNSDRIRLGPNEDGGYVLLNRGLQDIEVLYSYGVGTNSDFEFMFCKKFNAIARLYDHTVDSMPLERDFLYFKMEGVGPEKVENINTIQSHINENGDNNKKLILKMDVEGAEWETLYHIPYGILESFEQIIIEIHNLHSVKPEYKGINLSKSILDKKTYVIKKINKLFYLYHIHGNNYEPLFYINRLKMPNVMELTFVNKKYFKPKEYSKTVFPTKYDRPNNPDREDIKLHFWPFYFGTIHHILNIASQTGWIKGWKEILNLIYKRIETQCKSLLITIKLRRPTSYS